VLQPRKLPWNVSFPFVVLCCGHCSRMTKLLEMRTCCKLNITVLADTGFSGFYGCVIVLMKFVSQ